MPKSKTKSSLLGKRFRSVIADANVLWEVKKSRGRDVFECVAISEPVTIDGRTFDSDYAGATRCFGGAEIRSKRAMEEHFRSVMSEHAVFYGSLVAGEIVHYHDGFGEFVRCEVVVLTEDTRLDFDTKPAGSKVLKPTALVGRWRAEDLRADSRWPRRIKSGALFVPNAANVFESPNSTNHPVVDPRTMTAHVITGQTELFAS